MPSMIARKYNKKRRQQQQQQTIETMIIKDI